MGHGGIIDKNNRFDIDILGRVGIVGYS